MFISKKNTERIPEHSQTVSSSSSNLQNLIKNSEKDNFSSCTHEQISENSSINIEVIPEELDRKKKMFNRWMVQWQPQEDLVLFQKYVEIGSKWVQLSSYFCNKSDNAVKNRFYCCLRKVQKKMHSVQKKLSPKQNKPIGYDSLLTVLQIGKYRAEINDKRFMKIFQKQKEIMELRQLIIAVAMVPEHDINDATVIQLINKYLELKHTLKFINIQRVKKNLKKSLSSEVSLPKAGVSVEGEPTTAPSDGGNKTFQTPQIAPKQQQIELDKQFLREVQILDLPEFSLPKDNCLYSGGSCLGLQDLGVEELAFDHLFFI